MNQILLIQCMVFQKKDITPINILTIGVILWTSVQDTDINSKDIHFNIEVSMMLKIRQTV